MRKCEEMLRSAMSSGEMVEIYTNRNNTEKFGVGFVLAMDEEWMAIRYVSPDGGYDGINVYEIDRAYRVVRQSKYLECKRMLYQLVETGFVPDDQSDLRSQLLRYAQDKGCFVQVELLESDSWDIRGFVRAVGDGAELEEISEYGESDGVSAIDIDDISEICCDDEDCRRFAKQAELRRKG